MRCYFLRALDEDAIARAHTLSSKRKGPFDGFEGRRPHDLQLRGPRQEA